MPSRDLQAEAVALYVEHRETVLAVAAIGVLLLFVLLLFGGLGAAGGLFFLGYTLLWVAVVGVVLWLLNRFVTAVERIAAAQERMASARDRETIGAAATDASDSEGDEFASDGDEVGE